MKKTILLFLISVGFTVQAQTKQRSRPNIVFIIADDLSSDDLSCYGNQGIKTPNLQELAENGIIFHNAYLTAANCSPSRASMVTGRYPVSNGQTDLATGALPDYKVDFPEFFDGIDYFPEILQKSGYYTAQSGKWHLGYHWLQASGPAKRGFDLTDHRGGESGAENWTKILDDRPKNKPFFMWFAAHDPHDPWTAPKVHDITDVHVPPYLPDTEYMREQLAAYYDEIHRMDYFIGEVMDKLKEQQVYENTMIVFVADNGRGFWRSKAHIYDAGMKTPLLVSWPSKIKADQQSDHLISMVDLAPTFVEITGHAPEDYTFQGRSILPILKDVKSTNINQYAISEQNWHGYSSYYRSVRDASGYLYIQNGHPDRSGIGGKAFVDYMIRLNNKGELSKLQQDPFRFPRESEELYHYKNDVHQEKNLAADPAYVKKLNELRDVLGSWQKLTGDRVSSNEIPDWYQRPYSDEKPKKGIWGDSPGIRNFGVGKNEGKILELTRFELK
ncbi:sulfatase family protein [Flagellimonas sp. 2504JD4-2]